MIAILEGKIPTIPPENLLSQAIATGDIEALEHWFIEQTSPGYTFSVIAEFIESARGEVQA